jgi:hypothetical protein
MSKKEVKRVHIDGVEYTYVVGSGLNIVIRTPSRKTILTNLSKVFGMGWDVIERGYWKEWLPGVGPGDVKRWLTLYLKAGSVDLSVYPQGK